MELSYKFSQPILYLLSVDLQLILVIIYAKVVAEKNSRVIKTFHFYLLNLLKTQNKTSTNGAKPIYVDTIKSLKTSSITGLCRARKLVKST